MAALRASAVRALAARRNALILPHIFSIGLKSGEYGGRYSTVAPALFYQGRDVLVLVNRQVVQNHNVARAQRRHQDVLDIDQKRVPVRGGINRHAGGRAVQTTRRDHTGHAPMSMWRGVIRPSPQTGHVGFFPGSSIKISFSKGQAAPVPTTSPVPPSRPDGFSRPPEVSFFIGLIHAGQGVVDCRQRAREAQSRTKLRQRRVVVFGN